MYTPVPDGRLTRTKVIWTDCLRLVNLRIQCVMLPLPSRHTIKCPLNPHNKYVAFSDFLIISFRWPSVHLSRIFPIVDIHFGSVLPHPRRSKYTRLQNLSLLFCSRLITYDHRAPCLRLTCPQIRASLPFDGSRYPTTPLTRITTCTTPTTPVSAALTCRDTYGHGLPSKVTFP